MPKTKLEPIFSRRVVVSNSSVPNVKGKIMNSIIYLVGLVVVVLFILSALGLR